MTLEANEREAAADAINAKLAVLDELGAQTESGLMSYHQLPVDGGSLRVMLVKASYADGNVLDHTIVNEESLDVIKHTLTLRYWEFSFDRQTNAFNYGWGETTTDNMEGWTTEDIAHCALLETAGDKLTLLRGASNEIVAAYTGDELDFEEYLEDRQFMQRLAAFLQPLGNTSHEPNIVGELFL